MNLVHKKTARQIIGIFQLPSIYKIQTAYNWYLIFTI